MSFTLKSRYNDDVRRVPLAENVSFEDLQKKLTQLFKVDATKIIISYLDEEEDTVLITNTEELTEAIRISKLNNNGVLTVTVNDKPEPGQEKDICSGCPIEKLKKCKDAFFKKHCARWRERCAAARAQAEAQGPAGRCGARRGCCRVIGKVFCGLALAFLACKLLGFVLSHFFCLLLLAIPFIIIRKIHRWRRGASGVAGGAGGCCIKKFFNCPSVSAHCPFQSQQQPQEQVQVPSQPQPSAPVLAQPSPVPVSPVQQPAQPIVEPQPKNRFEQMLKSLNELGFADRNRNIELLVQNNFQLTPTIEQLIAQQQQPLN